VELDSVDDEDSVFKEELTVVHADKINRPKERKYGKFFFIQTPFDK
jgi:hypothetical protein